MRDTSYMYLILSWCYRNIQQLCIINEWKWQVKQYLTLFLDLTVHSFGKDPIYSLWNEESNRTGSDAIG